MNRSPGAASRVNVGGCHGNIDGTAGPRQYVSKNAAQHEKLLLAAQTCELLATTNYLAQDVLVVLLFNFYAINLDERARFTAQLVASARWTAQSSA